MILSDQNFGFDVERQPSRCELEIPTNTLTQVYKRTRVRGIDKIEVAYFAFFYEWCHL